MTLILTTVVQIERYKGDPDCDHSNPKTGCTHASYEKDGADEHEGHGDPK